jgi:hypothetical protein
MLLRIASARSAVGDGALGAGRVNSPRFQATASQSLQQRMAEWRFGFILGHRASPRTASPRYLRQNWTAPLAAPIRLRFTR